MGWDRMYSAKHWKMCGDKQVVDRKAELDDQFTWSEHDARWNVLRWNKVLKSAMVGNTYYAAIETRNNRTGRHCVYAAVCLTSGPSRYDGTIWGYKDMDETECPYYFDCPASILDLLTPTDNQYANQWREECRKRIAEKKERKAKRNEPVYVPTGVSIREERNWWHVSVGLITRRASKRSWHDPNQVVVAMIKMFGTDAQKREYAASGRECPKEWKEVAA